MKTPKYFFAFVDLSFIAYWAITAFHLIPDIYLYNDYQNPVLLNWNWSIFPLDILVSATGLYSLFLNKKKNIQWRVYALISLLLTSISGLQAISYWVFAREFDLTWWIPNLFLLIYPMCFISKLMKDIKNNYKHL